MKEAGSDLELGLQWSGLRSSCFWATATATRPRAAITSLFGWALALEQEREAEPVGAGVRPSRRKGEGVADAATPSPGCPCM